MNEAPDTRARLLDVAEELFAEHGLERVSVRDITEAAGANLGAINYHFGTREGLIEAVFERRISPVNKARLAALDALEAEARDHAPPVEAVLDALIRPAATACLNDPKGGAAFGKLFGRCLAEPGPEVEALLSRQFAPLAERFQRALSRALPDLSRTDIFWRLRFTFGALHHFLLTRDKFVPKWVGKRDAEAELRDLVGFAAAGFRSSSARNGGDEKCAAERKRRR
jgi:AcrR family transcriptional regulator